MTDTRLTPLIFEVKRATDAVGTFTGYASTFGGPPDSYGDIIESGAFAAALGDHQKAGTKPAMLWSHNQSEPIGAWLNMHEDSNGLAVTGKLTLETKRGAEAWALLKDEAIALSIGFSLAPGGATVKSGIRYLTKIGRLHEVSLVSIPANSRAKINKPSDVRSFEHMLRDVAGYSHKEAKRIATSGFRALDRDDRDTSLDLVLSEIETVKNLILSKG